MENPEPDSPQLSNEEWKAVQGDQDKLTEEVTSGLDQLSFHDKNNDAGDDEGVGEAAAVDVDIGAYDILPEEMWLEVLDKVVDPKDILNVIKAYPELDQPSQFHKASWLFGLVLPHLMTKHLVVEESDQGEAHLDSRELLQLRLVSKRWKYAVDKSLDNHAARHPLSPRSGNDAKLQPNVVVTIPETHFNYYRMWDCLLGATIFYGADDIDAFLEEVGDYDGNPFPGNSVILKIQVGDPWQALLKLVVLLEMFGKYVHDLEIGCPFYEQVVGDMELCHNILLCLTCVPNLRSLVTGKLFRTTNPEATNFYGTPESQDLFPELSNLKVFEWRGNSNAHSTWITRLLETYGKKDGLLKLGIPMNLFWTVNLADNQNLHLTELHIFLDDTFDGNIRRIGVHVKALPNYQEIRKFYLSFDGSEGIRRRQVEISELIGALAEFQFESVVLQDLQLLENEELQFFPEEAIIPAASITSFVVDDNFGLTFDFLKLLPNLKFLSVYVNEGKALVAFQKLRDHHRRIILGGKEEVDSVGAKLRLYLVKLYIPTLKIRRYGSIWKDLPKLEMLSFAVESGRGEYTVGVQFVKEYGNKAIFGPRPFVVHEMVEGWCRELEDEISGEVEMVFDDWGQWWEMVEGDGNQREDDGGWVTEEED